MKHFKEFNSFINEKLNTNQAIEDIFFTWDDYFDDERAGIEGGHTQNKTFTFNFENTDDGQFFDFQLDVETMLKNNKIKFDWYEDEQLIVKK